jgi:hypothetical protein
LLSGHKSGTAAQIISHGLTLINTDKTDDQDESHGEKPEPMRQTEGAWGLSSIRVSSVFIRG